MEVQMINMDNRISDQNSRNINREYKDRLFCKVFEDKRDLLDLYNAVNNTDYTDPETLEINTLEDVIYLGMRNDKSFLISDTMNLYEHNSSQCPNLPLRGLFYFSRLYESYVELQSIRIYGKTRIHLPTPQYVVFYNGTAAEPDRSVLRLSDSYVQKDMEPALECSAVMRNINYGHNKALMEKCKRLKEYAYLIAAIRKRVDKGISLIEAVTQSVDECIEQGILKDILLKNREEVIGMILTTFDQEEYEQTIRDESYQEGLNDGLTEGRLLTLLRMVQKKFRGGKSLADTAEALEEDISVLEPLYLAVKENPEASPEALLNTLKQQ